MAKRNTTEQEQEVFLFLNELRDSGVTNMWGATPYIERNFSELTRSKASELHVLWMKNFSSDGDYTVIEE
tara:strand:- start:804 stop:1013 length:210 start_codon:yes stop_codon:yes gene_type:complete